MTPRLLVVFDLIDELLTDEADDAAERVHQDEVRHASADDWAEIVSCVRKAMGMSGIAVLRSWAETDDDEVAILLLVDCSAGFREVRSIKELRRKFGDDLAPAIGAAALVGFAGWQRGPGVTQ